MPELEAASSHPLASLGTTIDCPGNRPFLIDRAGTVWVVASGKVDLFSVDVADGLPSGIRLHVARMEEGDAFFGVSAELMPAGIGVLAVGAGSTRLLQIERERLEELAASPDGRAEVARLVESFTTHLSQVATAPAPSVRAQAASAGDCLSLADGEICFPARGLVWLQVESGEVRPGGEDAPIKAQDGRFPVGPHGWVQARGETTVRAIDTLAYMSEDPSLDGLTRFARRVLLQVRTERRLYMEGERQRIESASATDRRLLEEAFSQLSSVLKREVTDEELLSDELQPLLAACRMVGKVAGVEFVDSVPADSPRFKRDPVGTLARLSRLRVRRVVLSCEWWKKDVGPLLGFLEVEKRPVALLPWGVGKYRMVDPFDSTIRPVSAERAQRLAPHAFSFYRSLPDRALGARDLISFAFRGTFADMMTAVACLVAGGLLATVVPITTGILFGSVIPGADRLQLGQVIGGLAVASVASITFQLVQGFALLRVEQRAEASLQAAVWDRLLNLPAPFFKKFSAGDLASRAMGISQLRQAVTGVVVTAVLGVVTSLFNLCLIFWYDQQLASVALGLAAILMLSSALWSRLQLHVQREVSAVQGRISGILLQLVTGISKIRVAGVEDRAFWVWAREFAKQRTLAYRAHVAANNLTTFDAFFPVVASMVLYVTIAWFEHPPLSTGAFMAFTAAFASFVSAFTSLNSAGVSLISAWPSYERGKPILETLPEVTANRTDPGELRGEVELSHVAFRYGDDGAPVLNDLSFSVQPGEFVALVGPSGSGKSTIFRLLLGFEEPQSGAIYYDHQDLAGLDVQGVRTQVGVVLQNGRMMPGDIYTNIVGASMLTQEDAWHAAALAGLDEDIRQMPMGMQTVISEGAGSFSGGQRQRLLIARAIVTRPRILLFDEATSALDNRTQAIVSHSLASLRATRIVIAHRLSTVQGADRIFVLDAGRVVQTGTYAELVAKPGPFQDLVSRQQF